MTAKYNYGGILDKKDIGGQKLGNFHHTVQLEKIDSKGELTERNIILRNELGDTLSVIKLPPNSLTKHSTSVYEFTNNESLKKRGGV